MVVSLFFITTDRFTWQVYGAGETAEVTASSLNIRSGAGTGYKIIGSLKKGKTFTINGTKNDKSGTKWYKLKYKSQTGYVSSKYVNIKRATVTSVSNLNGKVNTSKDPLTVRSGPGAGYSKLGTMNKGKTFAINGKAQDSTGLWWYRLSFNGKSGYVSSKYIKTSSAASSNTTVTNTKGIVNTKSDPLTVRSGPGVNYSSLGSIKKGTTIEISAKATSSDGNEWYKTTYNNKTGYVAASLVKLANESSNDEKTPSSNEGNTSSTEQKAITFQMGTATSDSGLNVRTGAGMNYDILTVLPYGATFTITGSSKASNNKLWYKYDYSNSKSGYVCSDYVKVKTVTSENSFEAYMTSQGFPESYKASLRALHEEHPQWVFKAVKVGYSWSDALDKEGVVGRNLVSSSAPISHRSTAKGSYNSSTKKWTKFDGSWYAANTKVIAYYMDPRNFMNESGIYQFMTHSYDSKSQTADTVKAVIKGSFMQSRNPGGGYSSYDKLINDAGKATGVNPNVLAAMIIQEQGWNGSSLVSGTYSGYSGYYNFFNIGAYTTSSMNAIQRGLWYAKGSGTGATSYYRPWNTPYKSIKGGAKFYADSYVSNNQDSYYSKKFNVYNGLSNVGSHQYMTFVAAAASEGSIVKKAYANNSNYPVVFEIPVYNGMPASRCQLP